MKIRGKYNLIVLAMAVLAAFLPCQTFAATYVPQAVAVSADLLAGTSASGIANFHYNIASLPAGSSARIQFSKDNASWYSAAGVLGEWTAISAIGGADLDLAAFTAAASWTAGDSFYYKLELNATPDLAQTPAVEDIRLDYSPAAGYEKTFIFDDYGNVGIGTAAPWYTLDVNGTINSDFYRVGGVAALGTTGGKVYVGSAADYDFGIYAGAADRLFIQNSTGNVGIGTTSPGSLLHLNGALGALSGGLAFGDGDTGLYENYDDNFRLQTAGIDRITIDGSGNVGIGTTAPSGLLHVAGGQCVTGDTLLRVRRRRKRQNERGEWIEEEYFEDCRIDQIKAGDEILTLDENTGRLVVSRVKALMDMGVKEIYRLTTATGKTIRTTANHPYLARKPKTVRTYAFIDASNIIYGCRQSGWRMDFKKLYSYLKNRFGASRIIYYAGEDVANARQQAFYNLLRQWGYELVIKPVKTFTGESGKITKKANVDVDLTFEAMLYFGEYDRAVFFTGDGDFYRLIAHCEVNKQRIWLFGNAERTARELKTLMGHRFSNLDNLRSGFEYFGKDKENGASNKKGQDPTIGSARCIMGSSYQAQNCVSRGDDGQATKNPSFSTGESPCGDSSLATAISSLSGNLPFVKSDDGGRWTKVADICEGMEIATADENSGRAVWETIAKIEKLPAEQVYDIEVEGTHNFVGNGIVAHNTYLQGADQLNTSFALRVQDSAAADKFVITNAGNVGIGTTSPAYTLDVNGGFRAGNATSTNALVFDPNTGNVGIGTAAPATKLELASADNAARSVYGTYYGNNSNPFSFVTQKSRSGVVGTQTIVNDGDTLFSFTGRGSDGNVFQDAASIRMHADGVPSAGSMPGRIVFYTTAAGATVPSQRMRIDSSGNVGIGTTSPAEALDVNGRVRLAQTTAPGTTTDRLYNVAGNLLWNGINLTGGGSLPGGTEGQMLYNNAGAWTAFNGLYWDAATSRLGIGTTLPTSALDVVGNVTASGTGQFGNLFVDGTANGFYNTASSQAYYGFAAAAAGGARPLLMSSGNGTTAFALNSETYIGASNPVPYGIVNVGGYFWIPRLGQAKIYKYNSDLSYSGVSMDLNAGNTDSYDITYGGGYFWIIDDNDDRIYRYDADFGYVDYFDLESGHDDVRGVAYYDGYLWITDLIDDKIYKYTAAGVYTGVSYSLYSQNLNPRGIEYYDGHFWIADYDYSRIYKYETNGNYTGTYFSVGAGGMGICYYDGYFWIANFGTDTVYSYVANAYSGGYIAMSTDGTERIRILNDGNVGIGTTAPARLLSINSSSNPILGINVSDAEKFVWGVATATGSGVNGTVSNDTFFRAVGNLAIGVGYAGSGLDPSMYFKSNGNVGIGTTAPDSPLHIVSSSNPVLKVERTTTGTSDVVTTAKMLAVTSGDMANGFGPAFVFSAKDSTSSAYDIGSFGAVRDGADNSGALVFRTPNAGTFAEAMRIDKSGNVGIGTTSPDSKLEVMANAVTGGENIAKFSVSDNATNYVSLYNNTSADGEFDPVFLGYNTSAARVPLAFIGSTPSGNDSGSVALVAFQARLSSMAVVANRPLFDFANYGTSVMRISSAGNVGIGTTSPAYTLDVNGGFRAGNATSTNALVLDPNTGNVGVGTATPGVKLDVAGIVRASDYLASPGIRSSIPDFYLENYNGVSWVKNIYVKGDSGNVGIGTTSPAELLDVNGRVRLAQTTAPETTADKLYNVSGNLLWNGVNLTAAGALPVGTEGQMLYNNAGAWTAFNGLHWDDTTSRLGIGTTSPGAVLHIQGGSSTGYSWTPIAGTTAIFENAHDSRSFVNIVGMATGQSELWFSDQDLQAVGRVRYDHTNDSLSLWSSNDQKVTIDSAGNVGIGTTGPAVKLQVIGTARFNAGQFTAQESDTPATGKHVSVGVVADTYGDIYAYDRTAGSAVNLSLQRLGGNVGIGTTAPTGKLSLGIPGSSGALKTWNIASQATLDAYTSNNAAFDRTLDISVIGSGEGTAGGGIVRFITNPVTSTTGVERMRIDNSGNVGIGTTAPGYLLSVAGTAYVNSLISAGSSSATSFTSYTTADAVLQGRTGYGVDIRYNGGTSGLYLNSTGNVGIGTVSPVHALSVYGDIQARRSAATGVYYFGDALSDYLYFDGTNYQFGSNGSLYVNRSGNVGIGTASPAYKLDVNGGFRAGNATSTNALVFDPNTGNVGVGTAVPGYSLDVTGIIRGNNDIFARNGNIRLGTANGFYGLYSATYDIGFSHTRDSVITTDMVIKVDSGNVGIGTTAPIYKLNVAGANAGTDVGDASLLGIVNTDTTANNTIGLAFGQANLSGTIQTVAGIDLVGVSHADGAQSGALAFATRNAGSWSEKLRISEAGNVGIGTTSPAEMLDVNGRVRLAQTTAPATTADRLYNVSGNLLWNGVNLTGGGSLPGGTEGQLLYNNAGAWTAFNGMYWDDATSRLGIGTTSPAYALDVNGTFAAGASTFGGDVLPAADNTYSLGSASYRWKDLYLGPGSLNIYNTTGTDADYMTLGYSSNVATLNVSRDGSGTYRPFAINQNGSEIFRLTGGNTLVLGAGDSGTPSEFTLRGAAASGTNVPGANIFFDASNGTGTGGSGSLAFRTASAASAQTVAHDATTAAVHDGSSAAKTFSHTVAANSDRILIVGVSNSALIGVNSITYGGQSLTQIISGANYVTAQLWYLINPPAGANNVVVNFSSSGVGAIIGASSYYNVDQAIPLGTPQTANGAITNPTVSVSSASGELVVDNVAVMSSAPTVGSGQTQRWNTNSSDVYGAGSSEPGAATVTMSWTASGFWATAAVGLKPSGTSASPNTLVTRLLIDNAGNVGIGTASPGTKLEVVGTGFFNNAGANEIALNSAGTNYGFISNQGTGIWSLGYGAAIGTLATPVLNWNSTGNVGIGTTSPGYKFTVQSEASEATLGSNVLTNGDFATNDFTGWTAGANWSAAGGAAAHTAGAAEAISQDITVTTGKYYQIDYTETGDTAGTLAFAIGSESVARAYWAATSVTIKTSGSTGTQTFSITPSSDYNGTIDNITVRLVTPASTPAFALLNADGTVGGVQIKAGGSGLNNIFIGSGSGRQNTTGYHNNALGYQSLYSNTTGYHNNALGVNSLYSNTTGNSNNALGYYSLYSNTTGYHNNALGLNSLYSNTTGNYNNALGLNSLYSNTTGNYNNALGYYSLYSNTSGNYNNALGYYSLYSNTSGNYNNALGREAGRYNETGSENNYFGYRAGGFGAGAVNSHSGTTAVGSYALYNLTTGNYNLGLGYKAGENLTSGSGNVIIGYDIDAPSATASNQLNIGNLIFGTSLDGRNATLSSGNVGIGTTAPTGKLTVRGDSSGAAADLLRLENLGTAAVNSGAGLQFIMNRTTGGATEFGRLDMLATSIDNTAYSGALQFKIAANGLLETVAEFGSANIVLNRPLQVNVAGDTGISYDLQFMNTGVSNIVSNGPLTISAGTIYRADNLTLTTRANEQTGDFGTAATTTATTLTDSGKAWTEDEWIGGTITIVAGAGKGQTQTITDNDATVITVADWDAALGDPSANSVYRLSYAPAGDVLANIANANAIFGGFKVLGNDNGGYAFRVAPDGSVYVGGEGAGESSLFVKQNITAYGGILSLRQLNISEAGTPTATSATSGGSCADSTAYYYKVTAVNGNGETTGTAQFTVTTGASGSGINLNTIAWSAVTGATGYKIYRSTENNDWDGDANDQWVDGKVVAAPAITYDDDCAGDTASLTPPTANTTGGKLAINTAGVSPTRRFEVLENTGAAPQMKIISDSSNYSEFYVDATGDLSLKLTGSGGDDLIVLDENLKICAGGDFGAVSCPAAGFSLSGTGNLIVENKVIADKFEQICPTGYVWVPGSAKHGTLPGFCVMKYEAKDAGGGVAESKAADAPWVSVTQENARAYCQALGEGYHLVSEAEWMTIAENIAATPINDIDAGAGLQLATGHTDNDPTNSLAAGTDPAVSACNLRLPLSDAANAFADNCQLRDSGAVYGYSGTGNQWSDTGYSAGGDNKSQLRVHALSNGNTVWDIAGNVWEWTDKISICAEHPYDLSATTTSQWMEYNLAAGINYQGFSYLRPADDGWSSTNGIGKIYTDAGDTSSAVRAFRRGGPWYDTSYAGVFALDLSNSPASSSGIVGFRCAR